MRLEDELFRRLRPNEQYLIQYGFQKQDDIYRYQTELENTGMYAIIIVDGNSVSGRVLDDLTYRR